MRKGLRFVARPHPGKRQDLSLPLGTVLKELIGVAQTTKQVKSMLLNRRVAVDGVARKDHRYPVGLYDVIELIDAKKAYRVVFAHNGKLGIVKIDPKEKDLKIQRVANKQIVKGNKLQLSFLNGRVQIVDDNKAPYKVGDSIVMDEKKAIKKHLAFKEGMFVQFIGGRHVGSFGQIKEIEGQKIIVQAEGAEFETLKEYAFVLGDKKSEVKVE